MKGRGIRMRRDGTSVSNEGKVIAIVVEERYNPLEEAMEGKRQMMRGMMTRIQTAGIGCDGQGYTTVSIRRLLEPVL